MGKRWLWHAEGIWHAQGHTKGVGTPEGNMGPLQQIQQQHTPQFLQHVNLGSHKTTTLNSNHYHQG
eukprot:5021102-Karenia_brevis.AAC.1